LGVPAQELSQLAGALDGEVDFVVHAVEGELDGGDVVD
jgi:hypothetical protein